MDKPRQAWKGATVVQEHVQDFWLAGFSFLLMTYQVLARKWRPQTFDEVTGERSVVQTLTNSLLKNRLHHAYLFTGTRGIGKTSIARIFAKCLNCESGISPNPCRKCKNCLEIENGTSLDLIEIDAASKTKVEDTRDILENVNYPALSSRFKIYLIDEVHMLSNHSFNALLKTLEEPPSHVKFLLATTDPQKLPTTILSRCLQFRLNKVSDADLLNHLEFILQKEEIVYDKKALSKIVKLSGGSVRDALSMIDYLIPFSNANINELAINEAFALSSQDQVLLFLKALINKNQQQLFELIDELFISGVDFKHFLEELINAFYDLALTKENIAISSPQIADLAPLISQEEIQVDYQILLNGFRDLNIHFDQKMAFGMTILRLLAFYSEEKPQESLANKIGQLTKVVPETKENQSFPMRLSELLPKLSLDDSTSALLLHATLAKTTNDCFYFKMLIKNSFLWNDKHELRLKKALADFYHQNINVKMEFVDSLDADTPFISKQKKEQERKNERLNSFTQDKNVANILQTFNAKIDTDSI